MSWPERVYSSTQRPAAITATKDRKTDSCNPQQKNLLWETACLWWSAAVKRARQEGLRLPPFDFPFPISSTLKYHKARLALVIHTHFSTPRGTEVQDFQVEKGRRMLLDTPDIMKHKTPHRGFHRAGEEKEWGKLIPKKPQHYFKLCKAAGWSISGWTGLSTDIIVIIYYITSHIAAFSIHPQPPPGALTLSLCSYVALVFQLSSI